MTAQDGPLYDADRAAASRRREQWLLAEGDAKFPLLLERLGRCRRLVDLGCGWGQLLQMAAGQTQELWGVDESPQRLRDCARACPQARLVRCRVQKLDLPSGHFDAAVACQMLHEVVLFAGPADLRAALDEIRRVLTEGGRLLLLDHLDAGDGEVTVELPAEALAQLRRFEQEFRYRRAAHEALAGGGIRISRRDLQDFLTKAHWLGSAMESLEMDETHNVFRKRPTVAALEAAGLAVAEWVELADIRRDLAGFGAKLLEGRPWRRKFLAVAVRS